jgi:hypothetical protein
VGKEGCRRRTGQGNVRGGLFFGGWDRDASLDARVRLSLSYRYHQFLTAGYENSGIAFYKQAAELGDKRAIQRLKGSQNAPIMQPGGPGSILNRGDDENLSAVNALKGGKDKDCMIM